MRTIKFRAKAHRVNGDIWIYGDLRHHKGDVCIFKQEGNSGEQVNRETIGQFTGMLDKHGKEIYEGDIVEVYDFTSVYARKYKGVVKMVHCSWVVEHVFYNSLSHQKLSFDDFAKQKTEIIGNIYDNPDLITFKIDTHKEDEE